MSDAAFNRPRRGSHAGFIATGTLLVAALSALVLTTACHTSAAAAVGRHARAIPSTDCVAVCGIGAMPALTPFDEHFYTPPPEGDDAAQED